jgi:putative transcriptional regulator
MKDKYFKELLKSIDETRAIHAGTLKPSRVFKFDPIMVKNLRLKLRASQAKFARMIGVSVDTLQNWEQGRRRPEGPALVLLKLVEAAPETVLKALHA